MTRSEPPRAAGGLGHRLRIARIDAAAAEAREQIRAIEQVSRAARRTTHSGTARALTNLYAKTLREERDR